MKNMEISKYVVSNADECKRLQESVDFLMREVKITGKGSLECRASLANNNDTTLIPDKHSEITNVILLRTIDGPARIREVTPGMVYISIGDKRYNLHMKEVDEK